MPERVDGLRTFAEFSQDPRWSSASRRTLQQSAYIAQSNGFDTVATRHLLGGLLDVAPTSTRLLHTIAISKDLNTPEKREAMRRRIGGEVDETQPLRELFVTRRAAEILGKTLEGRRRPVEPVSIYRQLMLHSPETLVFMLRNKEE